MPCTGCARRKQALKSLFARKKGGEIYAGAGFEGNENPYYAQQTIINPSTVDAHEPMQSYNGQVFANPHMMTPNRDQEYDNTPITFNRIGTRWGDMQLKNGLANGVASGRIWGYRGEGWYDNVVPTIPGQTRLIGGQNMPGYYVPRGGAPSQYQQFRDDTAGSQPMYPGGPGYVVANQIYNPGTGG